MEDLSGHYSRDWSEYVNVISQSPKAGHPKAGRSDFRNQRFKADTGEMRKMRTSFPPQENKGLRRLRRTKRGKHGKCGKCGRESAENAENADDWL